MANILYNMSLYDTYDPEFYAMLEAEYKTVTKTHMTSRHAMGALYGYYRSGMGTQEGLQFWEDNIIKYLDHLYCCDISTMMEAMLLNRSLPRTYFKEKIEKNYESILIEKWDEQMISQQRFQNTMVKLFPQIGYWNKDLWDLLIRDVTTKKKIRNIYFSIDYLTAF